MQRLAALVPRPKLHLTRFGVRITSPRELSVPPLREHGVLAPDAKPRALVVPHKPEPPAQDALPAECQATCAHLPPSTAEPGEAAEAGLRDRHGVGPKCGGWLKIIAAVLGQPLIEKILTHLGLQAQAARDRPPVGRSCKRLEILKSTRFRRPGAQGRGDRLRKSFSEQRFGGRLPGKAGRR